MHVKYPVATSGAVQHFDRPELQPDSKEPDSKEPFRLSIKLG